MVINVKVITTNDPNYNIRAFILNTVAKVKKIKAILKICFYPLVSKLNVFKFIRF